MIIETKFNKGDIVYFFYDGNIRWGKISDIRYNLGCKIIYEVSYIVERKEDQLFSDVSDVYKSIIKDLKSDIKRCKNEISNR